MTTTPSAPASNGQPADAVAEIRQAVRAAIEGTELVMVASGPHHVLVFNPLRLGRGMVSVSLPGGCVTHTQLVYFGHLEGVTPGNAHGPGCQGRPPVPGSLIVHLLTATPNCPSGTGGCTEYQDCTGDEEGAHEHHG